MQPARLMRISPGATRPILDHVIFCIVWDYQQTTSKIRAVVGYPKRTGKGRPVQPGGGYPSGCAQRYRPLGTQSAPAARQADSPGGQARRRSKRRTRLPAPDQCSPLGQDAHHAIAGPDHPRAMPHPQARSGYPRPSDDQMATCPVCGRLWSITAIRQSRMEEFKGRTITCTPMDAVDRTRDRSGEKSIASR